MIAKIKAAMDIRVDQDLITIARPDALAIYGMDGAIERQNRYREAGGEMILEDAFTTTDQITQLNRDVEAYCYKDIIKQ